MNSPTRSPSGLLKAWAALARWALWLVLAAWSVFALTWGTLHGWIVPRIGEFRPRLEQVASQALGVPVRIGEITAQSGGLIPAFELRDVVLLDREGREALRLPRILAAVSATSLWRLGFEQLYIDQPALDVRRDALGRLHIAGFDPEQGGRDDGKGADWLFSQTEVVIRRGTVRWTDEFRRAPPLELGQVDLVLRNRVRRHAVRLDATPPAGWGERFTMTAQFRQPLLSTRNGRWEDWDGQLHAVFPAVDVSQLRQYADLGIDFEQGRGALRLWADVSRATVTGGVADLALDEVSARVDRERAPLTLQAVSGRFSARQLAGGFEFATRDLQFTTAEGVRWPGGNVYLNYTEGEGRMPGRGELRADQLDLQALRQIAGHLPLGAPTHDALAAFAPTGRVEQLQASWQGRLEAPRQYQVRGRVQNLAVVAQAAPAAAGQHAAGTPGVRGASFEFDLDQAGGRATVSIERGALELPGIFDEPVLPLDRLSSRVLWQRNGERLSVQLPDLKFANADAEGQAQASWHTADAAAARGRSRYPGVLDLSGTLSRAEGARVHRYLPRVLPERVRQYVREAVRGGALSEARFRLRGDLHDMPFVDPKSGDFRISAQMRDVHFAYVPRMLQPAEAPAWPALTQLSGQLVFERAGMQILDAGGRMAGYPGLQVARAQARIADLANAVVEVDAGARGPLADMLALVGNSPLAGMTGRVLAQASGTGNADLQLKLGLPIATLDRSTVQGSVTLAGNDVQITPESPLLARARAVVAFSESGFAIQGAQARVLGGEARIEGGSRSPAAGGSEPAVLVRVQGTATAEGLRQAGELGPVARLAHNASGSAAYAAVLAFRRGGPDISVTSNLQGMALNLPPPLNKPADAALPLRFELAALPGARAASAAPALDQLSVELGRLASVQFVRETGAALPRVLRGSIAVGLAPGEGVPMPEEGVAANIQLAQADLDAWEAALGRIVATEGAPAGAQPPARGRDGPAQSYLPSTFAVRAKELLFEGRRLHNVVVGGSRDGPVWRASIDADELNGYAEYRQPLGAGAGRVYARLARLTIAPSATQDVEALLEQPADSVPALDIVVDDFELRGRKLGRLQIDAVNRGASVVLREGGIREWRLNKLLLTLPEASFSASGNWAPVDAQALGPGQRPPPVAAGAPRRTVMNFRLDVADSGDLLGRFGMKDVIRRGKGRLEGQVSWIGSPLALDYPTLGGQFSVSVESGQFLKADPGLAKLLGVLSLQSLPRRLALDFRDVFSEGFAFDFVRGDVHIEQGMAATNNLQMKGVNAAVLMEGKADIARETQQLKVVVVPEINAGTASLVATVINPAIGLGTFLAQLFLRRPLMEAATQEFLIEGSWYDPKVTKVDRRPPPSDRSDAGADGRGPGVVQ